jgi:hypothetical protein
MHTGELHTHFPIKHTTATHNSPHIKKSIHRTHTHMQIASFECQQRATSECIYLSYCSLLAKRRKEKCMQIYFQFNCMSIRSVGRSYARCKFKRFIFILHFSFITLFTAWAELKLWADSSLGHISHDFIYYTASARAIERESLPRKVREKSVW